MAHSSLSPEGRVILISGANRGIGRALAQRLHAEGYVQRLTSRPRPARLLAGLQSGDAQSSAPCPSGAQAPEMRTVRIQLRFRRSRRFGLSSPSKSAALRFNEDASMPCNVFTLTTAYRRSSIALVTKGTAPQRAHT